MNLKKFFILSAISLTSIYAYADLQVFPTRIPLSDKKRAAQISLRHRGNTSKRYKIETVFYKMGFDGSMTLVKEAKDQENSAIPYIRFSPKVVNLEPNMEQVVRVLANVPEALAEGEYRAHLYFEEMDDEVKESAKKAAPGNAVMTLNAKLAVAVPVIIQRGNPPGTVQLANLKLITLPDKRPAFSVEMLREGKKNVYGDFRVYFTGKDAAKTLVGQVNGVSSYIDKRVAVYPLNSAESVDLKDGTLRLEFLESSSIENPKVQATAEAPVKAVR